MERDQDNEDERDAFIQAVEMKVLEYQGKDFNEWHYYYEKLQEVDPHNPLLEVGFHGLPYFGGLKD